jgi:hypothetical protein
LSQIRLRHVFHDEALRDLPITKRCQASDAGEEPDMGYAEHDDATGVEATRLFPAFGPAYPGASAHAGGDRYAGYERFTGDEAPPFTRARVQPVVQSVVEPVVQPTGRPLAERLSRLRPDRLVLAGGSLAAAAAVAIAFATAAGSSTPLPPHTAATHAARPACPSPAPGH